MKKIIILLLCCGVLVSMAGCGGNTALPPAESPPTTVSETIITEVPIETTPPVTTVEPTEKEKEPTPTESKDQVTEQTVTAREPTEETKPIETAKLTEKNTGEEKVTSITEETVQSTTPQLTEKETTETEPPKEEPKAESIQETTQSEFDIHYWIKFAKEYAVSIGLILDSEAVDCWDNPIRAGVHCIYLERDIQSRLNRYAKDEDITDVWIWAESTSDDCYDIYIGYS